MYGAIVRPGRMQSLQGSLYRTEMTGGCLGQVHRGRAQGLRRVKRVRAAAVVWIGLLMTAGVAGAQEVPEAPVPAQASHVPESGGPVVTPAQAQTTSPAASQVG